MQMRARVFQKPIFNVLVVGCLVCLCFVGCTGQGDGGSESPGSVWEKASLRSGVSVVEGDSRLISVEVKGSQGGDIGDEVVVLLNYGSEVTTAPFSTGDLIIGKEDGGYILEVGNVEVAGTSVMVTGTRAPLDRAVIGRLAFDVDFASGESGQAMVSGGDALLERVVSSLQLGTEEYFEVASKDISGTEIVRWNSSEGTASVVVKEGSVRIGGKLRFALEAGLTGVSYFEAIASPAVEGTLIVEASAVTTADLEKVISVPLSSPIPFAAVVGGVPVGGYLEPEVELGLSAEFDGAIHLEGGLQGSASVDLGMIYENSNFDTVFKSNKELSWVGPTWSADATAGLRVWVTPKLKVSLYGVLAVGLGVRMSGVVDLDVLKSCYEASGELGASLEVGVEVLGLDVLSPEPFVFDLAAWPLGSGCLGACVPLCDGLECGDGGCPALANVCGQCPATFHCVDGECLPGCSCLGKECGDNGCGIQCGSCYNKSGAVDPTLCVAGVCCSPNCGGRQCGGDGCGGTCGSCANGQTCSNSGHCMVSCGSFTSSCGTTDCCAADELCVAGATGLECCRRECSNKDCGSDGCAGVCGICPPGCSCDLDGSKCDCSGLCECGDGFCDAEAPCFEETTKKCPDDCPVCGDGHCNWGENCSGCQQDCGKCTEECGDGICMPELGENCHTCSDDCGCPDGEVCHASECTICDNLCSNDQYECGIIAGCDCGGCDSGCLCISGACHCGSIGGSLSIAINSSSESYICGRDFFVSVEVTDLAECTVTVLLPDGSQKIMGPHSVMPDKPWSISFMQLNADVVFTEPGTYSVNVLCSASGGTTAVNSLYLTGRRAIGLVYAEGSEDDKAVAESQVQQYSASNGGASCAVAMAADSIQDILALNNKYAIVGVIGAQCMWSQAVVFPKCDGEVISCGNDLLDNDVYGYFVQCGAEEVDCPGVPQLFELSKNPNCITSWSDSLLYLVAGYGLSDTEMGLSSFMTIVDTKLP